MDYNDPSTWLTPDLHKQPAFGMTYQTRIDEICGLNEFGKPNVLLSWAPARENYSRYYCEWNDAGFGTKTELRAQYAHSTLFNDAGDELELPAPRWVLKQFVPPQQYAATDDKTRWMKKVHGQQVWLRESRPPRDTQGYYAPFITIAHHNGFCCQEAKKTKEKCWGEYRTPDESYLVLLRVAIERRAEEGADRPEAGITPRMLEQASREATARIEEKKRKADEAADRLITDNLDALFEHYTGVKSARRPAPILLSR